MTPEQLEKKLKKLEKKICCNTATGTGTGSVNSVLGTINRITSSGGTDPIIDISSSYVGQSSITTLGTIGTGVWNATTIGVTKGGTGLTSLGTALQQLRVNSGGTALEYFTPSGGGGISGSGTNLQLALWDGASSIFGKDKYTYSTSNNYPNITIGSGASVTYGASLSLRDVAGTLMSISSDGGPLSLYGSSTYRRVQIYAYAGQPVIADFYRPSTYNLMYLHGLITNDELTILSNTQGCYDITRTYPYIATGNNPHGYTDQTSFRQGNSAFNSFGSFVTFGNTTPTWQNHYAAFQNVWTKDGTNEMNKVYGFVNAVSEIKAGLITDLYGYYHYSPTITGGTITNHYGIYLPSITGGSKNVGIYSASVVTIGTDTPNASALLQVDSTSKGFLPPRMTGVQAEAISSPAEGLVIYSTDGTGVTITSKGWWGYNGATWLKLN